MVARLGLGRTPAPPRGARPLRCAAVFTRVDHIGVAVEDIDAALALYERDYEMTLVHREVVSAQGVEAVLLDVGENHVELLAPLGPIRPSASSLPSAAPGCITSPIR